MTYQQAMDKAAKDYLTELMQSVRGNVYKAALIAQYDRPHFYELLQRHGLDHRNFRPRPQHNEAQDPAARRPAAVRQQAAA